MLCKVNGIIARDNDMNAEKASQKFVYGSHCGMKMVFQTYFETGSIGARRSALNVTLAEIFGPPMRIVCSLNKAIMNVVQQQNWLPWEQVLMSFLLLLYGSGILFNETYGNQSGAVGNCPFSKIHHTPQGFFEERFVIYN